MAKLIEELKGDHVIIMSGFENIRDKGVSSEEGQRRFSRQTAAAIFCAGFHGHRLRGNP